MWSGWRSGCFDARRIGAGYLKSQIVPVQSWGAAALVSRCADAAVITSSLWLAYWLRGLDNAELYLPACLVALPLYFLVGGPAANPGRPGMGDSLQEIRRALTAWAWTLAGLLAIAWTAKITADYSRVVVGLWGLFGALGFSGWRLCRQSVARRGQAAPVALAAIAGAGERARRFANALDPQAFFGANLAGCFSESDPQPASGAPDDAALPVLGNLRDLVERASKGEFSTIFVAMRPEADEEARHLVTALCDTPASVYVVPTAHAEELGHARWVDCGGLPLVSVFETPYWGVNSWIKRMEDLALALSMLIVAAVPMLMVAAAVKATSPGPAVFRQRRHGINGREIRVWKFRTMTVVQDGAAVVQAVRGDARITPIGAFLRRTSLDELPQIFNVLKGDMSVVGPRPLTVPINQQYRRLIPGYMLRHRVRPGITGWAQIHGLRGAESPENMKKWVQYDLWYLTRWSLWLDLWIVVRSVPVLAGHPNAY